MRYPKVLIFSPTYEGKEYCREKFIEAVNNINYPNKEFMLIDNSATDDYYNMLKSKGIPVHKTPRNDDIWETLAASQNYARKYALANDFDYVLSLESDVYPPKDIIQKLMRHWKPVAGGWYMLGGYNHADTGKYIPHIPCIFITNQDGSTRHITKEEHTQLEGLGGLHRVHGLGLGCALIDINILKKFNFWVDNRFNKASDSFFYMELWNAKIPVYIDYDVTIEHEPNARSVSMYKKKGDLK